MKTLHSTEVVLIVVPPSVEAEARALLERLVKATLPNRLAWTIESELRLDLVTEEDP